MKYRPALPSPASDIPSPSRGGRMAAECNARLWVTYWTAWHVKIEPIGCPETSAHNYQRTLRNNLEERRPQVQRCGSLTSRIIKSCVKVRGNTCDLRAASRQKKLIVVIETASRTQLAQRMANTWMSPTGLLRRKCWAVAGRITGGIKRRARINIHAVVIARILWCI